MLIFGWCFEVAAWSRLWRWIVIKICLRACDMTLRSYFGEQNSTLGSVVPLAMFLLYGVCLCVDIWDFVWEYDPSFLFFCSRIVNILYVFFCGIYYLSFFAFLLPLSGRSSWSSGAGKFRTVWFCNVGNCFQIKKNINQDEIYTDFQRITIST